MRRAVCFDLMDTVLRDPYQEALTAATGLSLRELAAVRDKDTWPLFEIGAIDEGEFTRRYFLAGSGHTFDLDAFHRARRAGYAFLPGIEAILDELRAAGVALYVASNYPIWIEELRATFALDDRFDAVIASHHLRCRKPSPEFFAGLFTHVAERPDAGLFVDDRRENCDAAVRAGMPAHLFSTAEALRARLVSDGFIPGPPFGRVV
jgi:FMN hydrolase / 5-amino-6-(5-phospho-D-ribitylamino)uracil phosphatase